MTQFWCIFPIWIYETSGNYFDMLRVQQRALGADPLILLREA